MSNRSNNHNRSSAQRRLVGSFRPHPRGFAFVEFDSTQHTDFGALDSVFVPPSLVGSFLADDVVEVEVVSGRDGAAAAGAVRLFSRPRRLLAGVVDCSGLVPVLVPHSSLGRDPWPLLVSDRSLDGQVVVCRLVESDGGWSLSAPVAGPFPPDSPRAAQAVAVLRALGTPSVPPVSVSADDLLEMLHGDVEAILGGADLTHPASPSPQPNAVSRRDRTSAPVFTVDDAHTRDLDDAVAAYVVPGGVRVEVFVADVSAFVPKGSGLDVSALARGSSLYLAAGSFPMLPRSLSEDTLSLLPGVERLALTVAFTVPTSGPDAGVLQDVEVFRSTVRSKSRLTYLEVEGFLAGSPPGAAAPVAESLSLAARASEALSSSRSRRATLEQLFDPPLWEVKLGADGHPVRVRSDRAPRAQALVEALMVAANESVARWLTEHGVPALFRNHAGVDPEAEWLLSQVADVSAARSGAGSASAFDASALLEVMSELESRSPSKHAALRSLLASSMLRAEYFASPDVHFGLGASPYCHFTSPIRRFADLVTHRQVVSVLSGAAPAYSPGELAAVAAYLNRRTSALSWAESAERAALWSLLLSEECGRGRLVSEGVVQSVSRQGANLRLVEFGVSAHVPAARLGRSWEVSSDGLAGSSERVRLQVGQRLRVRVSGSDAPAGRLIAAPAA